VFSHGDFAKIIFCKNRALYSFVFDCRVLDCLVEFF
jgi:hypothetical protein